MSCKCHTTCTKKKGPGFCAAATVLSSQPDSTHRRSSGTDWNSASDLEYRAQFSRCISLRDRYTEDSHDRDHDPFNSLGVKVVLIMLLHMLSLSTFPCLFPLSLSLSLTHTFLPLSLLSLISLHVTHRLDSCPPSQTQCQRQRS